MIQGRAGLWGQRLSNTIPAAFFEAIRFYSIKIFASGYNPGFPMDDAL